MHELFILLYDISIIWQLHQQQYVCAEHMMHLQATVPSHDTYLANPTRHAAVATSGML